MTSDLFAVVEHQQWRGPFEGGVHFRDSLTEAVELADELTAESKKTPRPSRFPIFRLDGVDEDELHEWAIRNPDGSLTPTFFHDYGKRRGSPNSYTVVRRRLGTTEWTIAPEEDL